MTTSLILEAAGRAAALLAERHPQRSPTVTTSFKDAFTEAQKKAASRPSAVDILARLRAAGARVELTDNRLDISGPVPPELKNTVRVMAGAILAVLSGRHCYRCGLRTSRAGKLEAISLPDGLAIHRSCLREGER
jgi:hypothetical protein